MIQRERVATIRRLAIRGRGIKAIARRVNVSRNTVRRYVRWAVEPGLQIRPARRRLTHHWLAFARALFAGTTGGNAVVVNQRLAERGVNVSVWTIRRAVADLRRERYPDRIYRPAREPPRSADAISSGTDFARWEFDLMRTVAQGRRIPDNDELESELTLHLAYLQRFRPRVRNWKAFLITALNRKADNWVRDRQREGWRVTSLDRQMPSTGDEGITPQDRLAGFEASPEDRVALEKVRDELDPELRLVWDALIQENWNQVAVARRLGVHRNTIRNALRRIQEVLTRHGF